MSVQINTLSFSYPSAHAALFEDFSLQFHDGWTCVAGSNGCGKSTLLKLVAGMLLPDSGSVSCDGEAVYCAQETEEVPPDLYCAFWSGDNEVRRFFSRLLVGEEMLERYDTLSGGEKKRIQIACALAGRPSVLLLDEPTNHLDARTSALISGALASFRGTGIMVSHDRSFADALCGRTVYLYNESRAFAGGRDCIAADSYPCGLSGALELRQAGMEQTRGEWEQLDAKVASEKQRCARLEEENRRAKSRLSKKSFQPGDHDAARKIDVARLSGKDRRTGDAKSRLETQMRRTESGRDGIKKPVRRKEGFSVADDDSPKPVVIAETLLAAGSYSLRVPHIEICRGEKIAVTGQNGTGKTLFVRHVISRLEAAGRGDGVMYLPQEIAPEERHAVLAAFYALDEAEKGGVLSTLYRLGSEPERIAPLSASALPQDGTELSPGELRKLMIALAVRKPLSLLVLDEPTNHMDITSVLALEAALADVGCAVLVVSHDQAFLQRVTERSLCAVREGDRGELRAV